MAITYHDDLELTCGDDWLLIGLLLGDDDKPLDLLAGNTQLGWMLVDSQGQHRVTADDVTIEPQQGGIVHITVPESLTRTFQPGRYLDAIRVWVDGAAITEWRGVILANVDPFWAPPLPPALPPPEVETMIEEPPDDGQLYARKAGAWEPLPSGFSTKFEYTFDNNTAAPPSNSQLRFDNADPTLVTTLWLHNNDFDGIDESNLLTLVEDGFIIFVQDKDDPTKRVRFNATGPMTNLGTYCEIPVTYVSGLGTLNNNQRVIVMVYGGG